MKVTKKAFGRTKNAEVYCFTLENDNGMKVSAITYGCVITEIIVPDKYGNYENVVLGYDNLEDYEKLSPFYGAIVGRVAGRIKDSKFSLNGVEYQLPANEGKNHLHGNAEFSKAIWNAEITGDCSVMFSYISPDGSNGYPGEIHTQIVYELTNDNELKVLFNATSTKDTILNLTNHTYFNLSGNEKYEVSNHLLNANVSKYVELGSDFIPTGRLILTEGTTFDFSQNYELSLGINSKEYQHVLVGNGYDHALVFDTCKGKHLATLFDPQSGRIMKMLTNYPCFVLYSGNQLDKKYNGVCLEAQLLPDAIHNNNFGKIVLLANEKYSYMISYSFDYKT